MDKNLYHFCKIHLCLVGNILGSKIGPMCGKWFVSWNDLFKNYGGMMFMSWNGLILSEMTYLRPSLNFLKHLPFTWLFPLTNWSFDGLWELFEFDFSLMKLAYKDWVGNLGTILITYSEHKITWWNKHFSLQIIFTWWRDVIWSPFTCWSYAMEWSFIGTLETLMT